MQYQINIECKIFNILGVNIIFGILQNRRNECLFMKRRLFKGNKNTTVLPGMLCGGTHNNPRQIKRFSMHRLVYADRVTISISGPLRWGRWGGLEHVTILISRTRPLSNTKIFSYSPCAPFKISHRSLIFKLTLTWLFWRRMNILHILRPATSQGYGHVKGLILSQGKHHGIYVCKTCTRDIVGMRHREFQVCEVPEKGGIPR